jgi:hypothetical protein
MVDDSKYIIVPNTTDTVTHSNGAGDKLAELVLDNYRIISKMGARDGIHYILIKFKPGTRPARAGDQTPEHPTNPDIDLDAVNI